jgi:hypothetical protein
VRTLLTTTERMQRAKGIRWLAVKLLSYYLSTLVITLPLSLLEWIGGKAEDALEWIDLPAYRWRNAQDELQRELIRDNRRKAAPPPARDTGERCGGSGYVRKAESVGQYYEGKRCQGCVDCEHPPQASGEE